MDQSGAILISIYSRSATLPETCHSTYLVLNPLYLIRDPSLQPNFCLMPTELLNLINGLMHATFRQRLRIRRLARLPQCVSYSTARTHTPISWDVLFENGGKVREGTQTTSNIPGLITGWTISKDVSGGALLQVEPSHVEGEVAKSLGEITDANASGSNKLEYSLKELLSVARNRPLPELLPLISSLISDQKLEIADALFHSLGRFHPEEWVTMSKTHLVNQFIDGYLERGNWGEMLKWKDVLFTGQLSATRPDSYSFALMLRYCLLSAKNPSDSSQLAQNLIHNADGMLEVEKECQKLVEEAAVYSITVSDIFGTKLLSAGEVQKISQVPSLNVYPCNLVSFSCRSYFSF